MGKSNRCKWFIKDAGDYCYSPAVKGAMYCKVHASYMKKWVAKKHRESYSQANEINWTGYSKFDK